MTSQASIQVFPSSALAPEPHAFQTLLSRARAAPPADLAEARAVLDQLTALLDGPALIVPTAATEARASSLPDRGGLPAWKARRIRDHIEARLDGGVRNTELAQLVDLSVSYFCRAFKKTFGETAHLYVLRRRIVLAQGLMAQTRRSLADIALDCGFADQAHMTRVFGRLVGVSPHRWRREHGPVLQ
jgi:AraC-like DNA-binding protein